MSVHKHDRHESQLQFIETARQLEIFTLRNCVKFPKRYTFFHYDRNRAVIAIGVQ